MRLIAVAVTTGLEALHLATLSTIRIYAEAVRADVIVVDNATDKTKINVAKYANDCGYEKILYLPGSMLIKTREDIFKLCENSHFAALTKYKPEDVRFAGTFREDQYFCSEIFVAKPSVLANFEGIYNQGFLSFNEGLSNFLSIADVKTMALPLRFGWGKQTNGEAGFYNLDTEEAKRTFLQCVQEKKREALIQEKILEENQNEFQSKLEILAVTSLTPESPAAALQSWIAGGLEVVAVQQADEIESLKLLFPQVTYWEAAEPWESIYPNPSVPIREMLKVALKFNKPIMLINSDIEFYGPNYLLKEDGVYAGIRCNYKGTFNPKIEFHREIAGNLREPWGISVFILPPSVVKRLLKQNPKSPYEIGKPSWGYWLAISCKLLGFSVTEISENIFFHKAHPIKWRVADKKRGEKLIQEEWNILTFGWHLRNCLTDGRPGITEGVI